MRLLMFKKILVPIDLENQAFAEKSMRVAIQQANIHQAALHIITVIPGFGMSLVGNFFPEDTMIKAMAAVRVKLEEYVHQNVPGEIPVTFEVRQGKPHKGILKAAKKFRADLIIMPSHNYKRVEKALIGSCTSRVVAQARVSVMVIKPD